LTELDYLHAILLGFIQGATEFLPVSSSAHLALTQHWFNLAPNSPPLLLFDVLAHLGTLVAVFVIFSRSIVRYARRLMAESRRDWSGRRYAWRVAMLGITACIPTAIIGFSFKDSFEQAFENRALIAVCLICTGLLLAVTPLCRRPRLGWKNFRWYQAALVGVAQGLAILPGISRSGSTICAATFLGLRRRWAGEFSFFIVVPPIVGASLLKIKDTFELPADQLSTIPWGPVLAGSVVSLIVGVFALRLLLDIVRRAKLHYFALYCWLLATLILTGAV